MPDITFILKDGTEKKVDAKAGLSLMEVAVKEGIEAIEGACGGGLACATCHLYVHPDFKERTMPEDGEISEEEEDMLDLAFDVRDSSRLCCQIIVGDELEGLKVALPGAAVEW
ncbi:MAG: 2Fe-2S iron-sulfur cluster-binding protein [Alphaproteobacteria bacterium]|nr:2Fe-2S iron-sulfur cluster-binding protein [Alphaproteobacteria bacterium]